MSLLKKRCEGRVCTPDLIITMIAKPPLLTSWNSHCCFCQYILREQTIKNRFHVLQATGTQPGIRQPGLRGACKENEL
jgi:hypothetical protein